MNKAIRGRSTYQGLEVLIHFHIIGLQPSGQKARSGTKQDPKNVPSQLKNKATNLLRHHEPPGDIWGHLRETESRLGGNSESKKSCTLED